MLLSKGWGAHGAGPRAHPQGEGSARNPGFSHLGKKSPSEQKPSILPSVFLHTPLSFENFKKNEWFTNRVNVTVLSTKMQWASSSPRSLRGPHRQGRSSAGRRQVWVCAGSPRPAEDMSARLWPGVLNRRAAGGS